MFRVIIAGSRGFSDYSLLRDSMDFILSNMHDDIMVVCGKARGADKLGEQYALERGYNVAYFPAEWDKYGKSAGYIRNKRMAENADALVVFWDGKSRGTKNMIEIAVRHNLQIIIKKY